VTHYPGDNPVWIVGPPDADVNAQGGYYGNAPQAAAYKGSQETVKLLRDYKADVTIQPRKTNRSSVLHVCIASVPSNSTAILNDDSSRTISH
jgi:hypothetical protein